MVRLRSVKFDLAPSIYEEAEEHAANLDVGVEDLVRRVFLDWLKRQREDAQG